MDISDGSAIRSDRLLSVPQSLKVMLYYDDLEVCNPLGSSKKIHKLGLSYTLILHMYTQGTFLYKGIPILLIQINIYPMLLI